MNWNLREDGVLCADGQPFRIRHGVNGTNMPFVLEQDGRPDTQFATLGMAKLTARWRAQELAEFEA